MTKKREAQARNPHLASVELVTCKTGRHEATLWADADLGRLRRVLRSWGGPLFRGASFEARYHGGAVRALAWNDLAALVDLPAKAAPTAARRRTTPAPALALVPAAPDTSPTPDRRAGLVAVVKTIRHRGRSFDVTYWKKPSAAGVAA